MYRFAGLIVEHFCVKLDDPSRLGRHLVCDAMDFDSVQLREILVCDCVC